MTTMIHQSDAENESYLSDLALEGSAMIHGIELLLKKFELPPLK